MNELPATTAVTLYYPLASKAVSRWLSRFSAPGRQRKL